MKESEKIRQLIQLEEELKKMKSEYEERLLEVENNIEFTSMIWKIILYV